MKANTLSMKKEIKGNTVEGTSRVMYQRGFNDALRLVSEKLQVYSVTAPVESRAATFTPEQFMSLFDSLQEEGK